MRRGLGLLTGTLIVFAVACGASVSEPVDLSLPTTDADPSGVFNLESVNQGPLPQFSFPTATSNWIIDGEKFTITTSSTWIDSSHYTIQDIHTGATQDSIVFAAGTYAISNGKITFTTTNAPNSIPFQGSVTGPTLTVIFSNERWIYRRGS